VCLGENLETVADAQNRAAGAGEVFERGHHPGEAGDGAWPQVVAVGEAARHDHGVDALEVRVGVPELDRFGPDPLDRVKGVPVAIRAGEDGDPDPHVASLPAVGR
jgi:hypothetical protein